MRVLSVRTLATMVVAADKTPGQASEVDGSEIVEEFFALSNLFDSDTRLACNLTDPARTPGDKQVSVAKISTGKLLAPLLEAMRVGAAGRWSNEADLGETCRLLGKHVLLKTTSDNGKLNQVECDVFATGQIIARNRDLRNFLTDRHRVPTAQRVAALNKLVGSQVDVLSLRLVNVAIERAQPGRTSADTRAVLESTARMRSCTMATIYAAKPLSETQHARLANLLFKQAGHDVVVNAVIDPLVVGGLKIQRGDIVMDDTVSTKAEQFRRQLAS